MARNFTLGTLVQRCKERADKVNDPHIGDSDWKGYISTAYAQLYSVLVESGLRYFEKIAIFDHTDLLDNGDNGGQLALPADFLSLIDVDYVDSSSRHRTLLELLPHQRNHYADSSGGIGRAFMLAGPSLIVYPLPTEGIYEIGYVPQPRDLSSEADAYVVDVVTPDGEDYLIWTAALFAMTKEESDITPFKVGRDEAKSRLQTWAVQRLMNIQRSRIWDDEWEQTARSPDPWEDW